MLNGEQPWLVDGVLRRVTRQRHAATLGDRLHVGGRSVGSALAPLRSVDPDQAEPVRPSVGELGVDRVSVHHRCHDGRDGLLSVGRRNRNGQGHCDAGQTQRGEARLLSGGTNSHYRPDARLRRKGGPRGARPFGYNPAQPPPAPASRHLNPRCVLEGPQAVSRPQNGPTHPRSAPVVRGAWRSC